jgi:hypothetical protein
MKINKKAILGMLVAIVMSLGMMNGINHQKESSETNLIWVALTTYNGTQMTTSETFATGVYGCVMSSMMGALYGAAFGGSVGFAVGLDVGI